MIRYLRPRDLQLLWARAAGMCSHPDCKKRLIVKATGKDEASTIGEAAHIVARMEGGPRGRADISAEELDRYGNLILLCANHHTMVDGQPETYSVEVLLGWKAAHEAWVESATANVRGRVAWTAIVQEEGRRIDMSQMYETLGWENELASLIELRNDPDRDGWRECSRREWRTVEFTLASTLPERQRFAVFSLGRIPLAVQLGYVLADRTRVALFQYDRERSSWSWRQGAQGAGAVTWSAADCEEGPRDEAAIRVSLSAEVRPEPELRCGLEVDIRVPEPSVGWLRAPEQLQELARVYGEALGATRARSCRRIHLYYAGPAPGAVAFGRAYNPRMNPELVLYEYRRGRAPSYERALVLNG